MYSKVLGTGSFLPEKVLTNADLEKIVDTDDEWIVSRTGIKERRISEGETASTMAEKASLRAMEMAGLKPEDIGMIVVATCTGDRQFPSTACILQARLGIKNGCPAFDVHATCAGFGYALSVADQYVKNGAAKYALVVGTEVLTRFLDWTDRSTCILFGDGAGAFVIGQSEEPGIYATTMHADGSHHDVLYAPNYFETPAYEPESPHLKMNGQEVFKFAVNSLGGLVGEMLEKTGLKADDIDWLVPHQANIRIIQATAKKLKMPMDKVVVTVDRHGNTSSASIPLAMDEAVRDGRIKRGDICLLETFGGGFAWAAATLKF
ncbi:MAG: 3-oxoacyl-[acyl-carrier-protein] synthase 3 [marine bacterium B5-7]|nr:MAG: 3-oxoacyl-[acyl-carrier-protein] synthase 3 [marine bacterium B5-7]